MFMSGTLLAGACTGTVENEPGETPGIPDPTRSVTS